MLRGRTIFATLPSRSAGWRAMASKPAAAALSREDEQQQRAQMIAEVMREKTMREVSQAGDKRRPEGITHVLREKDPDTRYAANYDDDRDEWGGPKGDEP